MTSERSGVVAWAGLAAFAATALATLALVAFQDAPGSQAFVLAAAGFPIAGALIAARQPRNAVGWLLLGVGLGFGVNSLLTAYAGAEGLPGRTGAAWTADWWWHVWLVTAVLMLPLVFPNGRLLSRRWRGAVWVALAALLFSAAADAFNPRPIDLDGFGRAANPLAAHDGLESLRSVAALLGQAAYAVGYLLATAALVQRFRRSRGRERQQLKWFAYVGLLAMAALGLALLSSLPGDDPPPWAKIAGPIGWFSALALVLVGLPVATGIAILRHRLYDIDVVINRTLVYGALTVALAVTYLGCVLLLQLVLAPLTADSSLAIAASTLAVAALFRPARARIQRAVDRRFFRHRYDAARTLEAFTARLRDEVDLDEVARELRTVVGETVRPAGVSLWLRGRG
jgi:hypothetical protein